MQQVLGELFPLALVIFISPLPIVAQILILLSPKPIGNGLSYLIGFVLGVAAFLAVLVFIGSGPLANSATSTSTGWIKIALGALVVFLGARRLGRETVTGEDGEPERPKWMKGIDEFTPRRSLVLAFLLGAINPKNVVIGAGAAVVISAAPISNSQSALAIVFYALIAAGGVAIPLTLRVVLGETADARLAGWKAWLLLHNNAVMGSVLIFLGASIIGKGFGFI